MAAAPASGREQKPAYSSADPLDSTPASLRISFTEWDLWKASHPRQSGKGKGRTRAALPVVPNQAAHVRGCEKNVGPSNFCAGTHNSQHRYRALSESDGPRAGDRNALQHRVCSNYRAFHSLRRTRTDVPSAGRFRSGLCICVLNVYTDGPESTPFFAVPDVRGSVCRAETDARVIATR